MPDPRPGPERFGESIAIYTGRGLKKWGPHDITAPGGLSGSETAAVRVAEQLVALGHSVAVYGAMAEDLEHNGVLYRGLPSFDPTAHRRAVIVSREPKTVDVDLNADMTLLWMHDHSYGQELTAERAAKFDAGLVLSAWHEETMREQYPFLGEGFLHRIRNGIEPSFFRGDDLAPVEYDPTQVIYSSSPERAIQFLLELWPLVREREPEAKLAFSYADTMSVMIKRYPILGGFKKKVARLADQPGVEDMGALAQDGLALRLRAAGVWVHPAWVVADQQGFNETFSIAAAEAAAAGCVLVMSPWGGLLERGDLALEHRFVPEPDPVLWADAIAEAIATARARGPFLGPWPFDPSWAAVAKDIEGIIDTHLAASTA